MFLRIGPIIWNTVKFSVLEVHTCTPIGVPTVSYPGTKIFSVTVELEDYHNQENSFSWSPCGPGGDEDYGKSYCNNVTGRN